MTIKVKESKIDNCIKELKRYLEHPSHSHKGIFESYHSKTVSVLESRIINPNFREAKASRSHHHIYAGGLAIHTLEVLNMCVNFPVSVLNVQFDSDWKEIMRIFFISALYHDYCKIFEYDEMSNKTNWGDQIGHVVGGYQMFQEDHASLGELTGQEINIISHILLSHHGKKEWGSPVEPQTAFAAIFHYADMLSAFYGKGK